MVESVEASVFASKPFSSSNISSGEFSVKSTSAGEADPSATSCAAMAGPSPLRTFTDTPVCFSKSFANAATTCSCCALYKVSVAASEFSGNAAAAASTAMPQSVRSTGRERVVFIAVIPFVVVRRLVAGVCFIASINSSFKQPRADKRTRPHARRAREHRAAHMRGELIHHVELCQPFIDRNETAARIALVRDEDQPSVILGFLTPWRPPLDIKIGAVVIRIRTAQDLRTVVRCLVRQTHVRVFGNHLIAVFVSGIEIQRIGFVLLADRRTAVFLAAHH